MNVFEAQIKIASQRRWLRIASLIVAAVSTGIALDSGWWTAGLLALAFSEIFRD